ncbi:HD domain-containing phosphohydrolase [Marinicrinis sediminis]|uniref:HD domain-containing phosphohydrolase n=1 Tax=Marinicrinis sediminis TaxID=1652465 RepID=A0ABW5R908_9BACL
MQEINMRHAKIMVVDDHESNVRLLCRILEHHGFPYVCATSDAREVMLLIELCQPDLVLLDLNMPYLNGFDLFEQIKGSDLKRISVLMMTSADDRDNKLKALELGFDDFIGKPFDQAELMLRIEHALKIKLMSDQLQTANEQLERLVQEQKQHAENAQIEILDRLGLVASMYDDNTGMHIKRMSLYAEELGKAAGLDPQQCRLLRYASTLHDIGKVGIPHHILMKPSKLNEAEWQTMKWHTKLGAYLLSNSSSKVIQLAETIALTHHEKWNGSGYPLGLKRYEIPLYGRITAICDMFDALVSDRPYKQAWEVDDAFEEIEAQSEIAFDPELVQLFVHIKPQIVAIKKQFDQMPPLSAFTRSSIISSNYDQQEDSIC